MSKKLAIKVENVGVQLFKRNGFLGRKTKFHWALDNVSFDVNRGEVLGIIGRNGAGKSTLLRLLAAIIDPDRGKIRRYGNKACLLALQTGFVPELTGRENALLSGMFLGFSKSEIEGLLPEIKEFSELGDWFEQPIQTYSSGMKARLGFSAAINVPSDIILVDETLGVGDTGFKKKSSEAMRSIMKSDRTVILVSHSASMIQEMSDRAVWLEQGHTIMSGDPKKVSGQYEAFWDETLALQNDGLPLNQAIEQVLSKHIQ